jgi:hypothetical protein
MSILQKDIKLLWGRSANRCAICKKELSQDSQLAGGSFPIGEQSHIVGEKQGAPRGESILSEQERNSYANLILLCPNDHALIDKNPIDWPVEKLYMAKTQHELWVQQTLAETIDSKKVISEAIVASIVDHAVGGCRLAEWQNWTSSALSPDPKWPSDLPEQVFRFQEKVMAAVWPEGAEVEELKRATTTLAILINRAAQTFLEHSKRRGDTLYPHKFYQWDGRYNPNYEKDCQRYEEWVEQCHALVAEATKAANWFADVVRKDVNPMFFAVEGKFLVTEGLFEDLSFHTRLLEFNDEQKTHLPEALFDREQSRSQDEP